MTEIKKETAFVHYPFPKIPSFKNWWPSYEKSTRQRQHTEKDEKEKPKSLRFLGSIKVHGTNAGLIHRGSDNIIYGQGRNRTMTLDAGNQFGFAEWYTDTQRNLALQYIFKWIREEFKVDSNQNIVLYGEFAGPDIQYKPKNLAVKFLKNKSFFGFACQTKPEGRWLDLRKMGANIENRDLDIYNTFQFQQFEITIELTPEGILNAGEELKKMAQQVQDECPIGKALGIPNKVGEGIVFATNSEEGSSWMSNVFKAKGSLFSESKDDDGPDPEHETKAKNSKETHRLKIQAFAKKHLTEHRMDKAWDALSETGQEIKLSFIPAFVEWLAHDVALEEKDAYEALQTKSFKEWKTFVGEVAVPYFKKVLEEHLKETKKDVKIEEKVKVEVTKSYPELKQDTVIVFDALPPQAIIHIDGSAMSIPFIIQDSSGEITPGSKFVIEQIDTFKDACLFYLRSVKE